MKAFVEWMCEHSGVVRVGENCEKFGDPFEFAVAFVVKTVDGRRIATVKALVNSGETRLKRDYGRALIAALASAGLECEWERIKQ